MPHYIQITPDGKRVRVDYEMNTPVRKRQRMETQLTFFKRHPEMAKKGQMAMLERELKRLRKEDSAAT